MVMAMEMAAKMALFVKPAIPSIWSAMMVYQLGYINISRIYRIKNRLASIVARVCKSALGLFMLWLFLKQFVFVDMNMHRFADSNWLPLIEAVFR